MKRKRFGSRKSMNYSKECMKRFVFFGIVFLLVILFVTAAYAEDRITLNPLRVGTHNVPELSGVVASRQYSGVYWSMGDSDTGAWVYAINSSGFRVKAFSVTNGNNRDWEDIALDESNNIWIAETGDNAQTAGTYYYYVFPEPDPYGVAGSTAPAIRYAFRYPDGNKDSEASFIWQGVVYIVQKRPTNARVYRLSELDSSKTVSAEFVGEFNNNNNWITGADISRDGRRLALIHDGNDYHWVIERNVSSTNLTDFFNSPIKQWRIQFGNGQGEAIGFVNGSYELTVISEGVACGATWCGDFWYINQSRYDKEPLCSEGRILGLCKCGIANYNFGYCMEGTWYESVVSTCGNGILEDEECDDGNLDDGDGCSLCKNEASLMRFAVIGDYGSNLSFERDVANLVKSYAPEFIITTGDNNYDNGANSTIDSNIGQFYHEFIFPYYGSYGNGADKNRFFPTLGNHDWNTVNSSGHPWPYLNYFTLPGNERYYNFSWGNLSFFAIDSDTREPGGTSSDSKQARWLRDALGNSTAQLNVVYMHHAPYSSGTGHGSTAGMQWPYRAWGADVVLAGHEHTYEHIVKENEGNLSYFVNGAGGKSLYSFGAPVSGSLVRYNSDYGAMSVEVFSKAAVFKFINRANTTIESYAIPLNFTRVKERMMECVDSDGDGYNTTGGNCGNVDCNDSEANVNPSVVENCGDNIDNNCDTQIDEGCIGGSVPNVPSGLTASLAEQAINLLWGDNSDNEEQFVIERSIDGVNWIEIARVGVNATNYNDREIGLSPREIGDVLGNFFRKVTGYFIRG